MVKEEIINLIKKAKETGISLNKLIYQFKGINITKELEELELSGKIYKNELNKYTLFPENYMIGEIVCDHKGNRFVTNNEQKYYVNFDDLNGTLDFDIVVFEPNYANKRAVVKGILKRKNNKIVCEVHSKGNKKYLRSFNTPSIIDIKIDKALLENYVDGDRLVVEIDNNIFLDTAYGKIISYIGHKNDPYIDEACIANARGFNTYFDDEYMEELGKLPKEVTEEDIKKVVDLRDKEIFTIDSSTTKDIDDAISFEMLDNGNSLLGVHIAPLSRIIKPDSKIFKEAYERGTSVYLGDSVIPMFHPIISNGICSLNPDVDRLAKSCFMEINSRGNVVNYKICDSVIHSKKKMTYEDVNEILENKNIPEGYEPFVNTLMMMSGLSDTLTEKRENYGAVEFASNEIKIIHDEHNKVVEFKKHKQHSAEKIIENFMIIANETIAKHISNMGLPFVYRIHDEPDEYKLEKAISLVKDLGYRLNFLKDIDKPFLLQAILKELSTKEEFSVLSTLFLKSMDKAKYSNINIGHYGLASENYTHFTSPIRRLPDLLVHTLLDYYNNANEEIDFKYLDDSLKEACEHASYKERQADLAEEELNRLRMVEYMEEHIGETFCGRILEIYEDEINIITDDNIFGSVPLTFIESHNLHFHPSNKSMTNSENVYLIGNKVEVKVLGVSKELRKVFFEIHDNLSLKNSSKAKKLKKKN